jgi:hypothetical protein
MAGMKAIIIATLFCSALAVRNLYKNNFKNILRKNCLQQQNLTELLYEENGLGEITRNLFDQDPPLTNLAPVQGNFNPSGRLESCERLGEGRFPVYGDCSMFLECEANGYVFTRRIVGCLNGFWYK